MATERTPTGRGRRAASVRLGALLALLACLCVPPFALAQTIPSNLRAAILLRALQYEKVFASGTAPAVILVLGGSAGSRDAAEMTAALQKLANAGATARKVVVEEVRGDASASELARRSASVVYVAEGNETVLPIAVSLAGAMVLCGDASAVGKGCMLSVEPSGTSSRLVVDLGAATKKGFTFDARMLRVARVIR
jgi:hypothetical protein